MYSTIVWFVIFLKTLPIYEAFNPKIPEICEAERAEAAMMVTDPWNIGKISSTKETPYGNDMKIAKFPYFEEKPAFKDYDMQVISPYMVTPLKFVGIQNYVTVFKNQAFILSLKNMARMVFFSVLFHTPIALLLAVAINAKYKGYRFFKVVYFVPTIFPLTAIGLLWYFIFMPNGSFNELLAIAGFKNPVTGWLIESATAMNTIIFVNI